MFFVLAAFGCLVIDRDVSRARLARAVTAGGTSGAGPGIGIRWWRVAAGFFIGCACACKWDAIWYLVAFAALALAWDVGARRAAGIGHFWRGALVRDGKWLPLTFGVLPLAVYIASWTGWFASSLGYDRNYAVAQGFRTPVLSALYSLYEYHVQMLQFSVGLHTHHPYESQPFNPQTVFKLQHATRSRRYEIFKEYTRSTRRPGTRAETCPRGKVLRRRKRQAYAKFPAIVSDIRAALSDRPAAEGVTFG